MRDDEEVVLLALEFENDGFEADGEVVVGLVMLAWSQKVWKCCAYLSTRVSVVVRVLFVLADLVRVLLSDPALTHFFADSRVQLAHLTALSDTVTLLL